MSTPCDEQVVLAVVAALEALATGASPTVPGLAVHRNRVEPIVDLPAANILEDGLEIYRDVIGEEARAARITVDVYAQAASDAAAETSRSEVRARVMAAMDGLLATSGLALRDVRLEETPASPPLSLDGKGAVRIGSATWSVEYAIAEGDPYTFA